MHNMAWPLITIDAGRGGVDDPAHAVYPGGLEGIESPGHIDMMGANRVLDRALYAGPRRRVEYPVRRFCGGYQQVHSRYGAF